MQNTMHNGRNAGSSAWQAHEVEALINELKKILKHEDAATGDGDIREELKVLERWEDHFHRDLVTADAFSKTSTLLLSTMHDRLKLDIEERHRLEGEGGVTLSKEQAERNEARMVALRSIERILNREANIKH